eukprot:6651790-Alexandrium_andersonii.AAC.1
MTHTWLFVCYQSPESLVGPVSAATRPQSAIRHAWNAKSLQAVEPGTARAHGRPQNWSPKLAR